MSNETRSMAVYVQCALGKVYVLLPEDNPWGFTILDDHVYYPGGHGIEAPWIILRDDDPRVRDEDRARLAWALSEARSTPGAVSDPPIRPAPRVG